MFFIFILNKNMYAQTPAPTDVQALRAAIDALKADYEKRLQALEEKVSALQGGAPPQQPQTQVPQTQLPQTQLPVEQIPAASTGLAGSELSNAKVFNPHMAVM